MTSCLISSTNCELRVERIDGAIDALEEPWLGVLLISMFSVNRGGDFSIKVGEVEAVAVGCCCWAAGLLPALK